MSQDDLFQVQRPEVGRPTDRRVDSEFLAGRPELRGLRPFDPTRDVDLTDEINRVAANLRAEIASKAVSTPAWAISSTTENPRAPEQEELDANEVIHGSRLTPSGAVQPLTWEPHTRMGQWVERGEPTATVADVQATQVVATEAKEVADNAKSVADTAQERADLAVTSAQSAEENAARAKRTALLDTYGTDSAALNAALAAAGVQTLDVSRGAILNAPVVIAQDVALLGHAAPQWHGLLELTGDNLLTATTDVDQLLTVAGRDFRTPDFPSKIGSFSLTGMKLQGRIRDGMTPSGGALDGIVCTAGGGPMSPYLLRDNHARGFRHVYSFRMPGGTYPDAEPIHPAYRGQPITTGAFNVEIIGGTYTSNTNLLHASGANAIGNVTLRNVVNRAGGRVYTETGSMYGSVTISDMLSEGQTQPYRLGLAFATVNGRRAYFEGNWEVDAQGRTIDGTPGCLFDVEATNDYSTVDLAEIYAKNDGHYARFRNLALRFDADRLDVYLRKTHVRHLAAQRVYADLSGVPYVLNTFELPAIANRPPPGAVARGGGTYTVTNGVSTSTPFGPKMASTGGDQWVDLNFANAAGDTLEICLMAWTSTGTDEYVGFRLLSNSGATIYSTANDQIKVPGGQVVALHLAVPLPQAHGGFLFKLTGNVRFTEAYAVARPGGAPLGLWVPRT